MCKSAGKRVVCAACMRVCIFVFVCMSVRAHPYVGWACSGDHAAGEHTCLGLLQCSTACTACAHLARSTAPVHKRMVMVLLLVQVVLLRLLLLQEVVVVLMVVVVLLLLLLLLQQLLVLLDLVLGAGALC